ncbi:ATPase/histidine kinase/DNA gyrase B/HSP90 domain protein [Marvinbryantia formatexigens DSM 14469]|uniref:ATPase/histidine kinase/DNA gyrase B/HSP90 domain protein n=1 Tax=Marvinbryantia formatexigens DSM 14469 TaxID=478749 RepID=C6L9K1_9FIRM|nr:ATP-binding protein [Marvinbryantia formatexigens]EET62940.1 ATPase/histidine kinase/DNA gyrase B/HSP90 domain protein [Marvinbryantia formatexigens DSM 14469]UWO23525.1 ATP-binding protein [Marvinbryantia formatexigens DSM 14469]SDG55328.1 GHKL domain-containing protein [Marvinbryantia formatexigens]
MLTGLSVYKVMFMIQLLAGEGLFLVRLSRRKDFYLRCSIFVLVMVLAAAVFPVPSDGVWYMSFLYLSLFALTLAGLAFCFEEPFWNLVFCGIGGYTVQHLGYLLYMSFIDGTGLGRIYGTVINPYSTGAVETNDLAFLEIVFYIDFYFLVYTGAFEIFDRLLRKNRNLYLGRIHMIFLSALLIGADVVFNMITNYYTTDNIVSLLLERGYNIVLCLLILGLMYFQLSQREMRDELRVVQYILQQGRQQYDLAKKSRELVNIKYHDLRHQQEQMRLRAASREEQDELESVLSDYDVQVYTDCGTLDVILTEKNMLCKDRKIQLLCMADGAELDFVKPHHLYALLGNALDNAIEAVQKLPEEERIISVYIRRQGALVYLHVENPCEGTVPLRDGLPVTTKDDHNYHGYGMLSMKTVAEQYGGALSVQTEEGIFSLDVVLQEQAME